jgi:hypothetical protein
MTSRPRRPLHRALRAHLRGRPHPQRTPENYPYYPTQGDISIEFPMGTFLTSVDISNYFFAK